MEAPCVHAAVGAAKRRAIQLGVAGICLALAGAYCLWHGSDLGVVLKLRPLDLAALVLLGVIANFLGAYRLFVILRWLDLRDLSFGKWTRVFVSSRFANFYITQGANVYRAMKLKKEYSLSYSQSIGLAGVISCADVGSVLCATAVILLCGGGPQFWLGLPLLGAGVLLVGALGALPRITRRLGRREISAAGQGRWGWFLDRLEATSGVLARCTRDGATIAFLGGMTVLVYFAYVLGVYVCLRSFGQDISLYHAALVASALVLSRTINLIPGNLGISELITGLSAGALAGGVVYGVMISVIFRVVDFAVVGTALLAFTAADAAGRGGGRGRRALAPACPEAAGSRDRE